MAYAYFSNFLPTFYGVSSYLLRRQFLPSTASGPTFYGVSSYLLRRRVLPSTASGPAVAPGAAAGLALGSFPHTQVPHLSCI